MPPTANNLTHTANKSLLDRALSLFSDVRAGEGATVALMMANVFLLLICYSVIKTVREPLILLGGGAEVRSYAAAGQALLLMGLVPLYSWFASRMSRPQLLVGVTVFFIVCIELFALAVAAHLPYVGVAFFIWVGIFNVSLVAQFWSFANDLYSKEAGDRLFPIIVIGMAAGAPLGSLVAARLFRFGFTPQVILQVSALLLSVTVFLYLRVNRRETTRANAAPAMLSAEGGFRLVLGNRYLRLVALLVVLLNVVNTTGEYLIAKLLTIHVTELALVDAAFDRQAYVGAFYGEYQFWVNVTALLLQAFVASRLIRHAGLRGALLALPLIALGGYSLIAAGAGLSVMRWVKTAENATDYSIMNTARQLLWLPTTREEKYKAKQAIDTFFVRGGDVLSAAAVYLGTSVLQLTVDQFAVGNIALTLMWLGVALLILKPSFALPRLSILSLAPRVAAAIVVLLALVAPAQAQDTREGRLAAERAEKAKTLRPYEPDPLERRLETIDRVLSAQPPVYPFIGSIFEGGGLAVGPAYRARYSESGAFTAHAAWSVKNYKEADAALRLPTVADGRVQVEMRGNWVDAPSVGFYGVGNDSHTDDRTSYRYRATTGGVSARVQAARFVAVGSSLEAIDIESRPAIDAEVGAIDPTYRRSQVFAEVDWRTSPSYTRRGGFYRVDWSDFRQINDGRHSFSRVDAEVQQFVPLLRENWVIALRALASSTETGAGQEVPSFMLPELGGHHVLRGYSSWRFRDRNRLLFTGEYRWTAGPFVDMAVFVDAGKVAGRRADLNLRDLKTSHGLELSIHTPSATMARIGVARSHEGTSLTLSFSPSF